MPARDEQERIGACLQALAAQVDVAPGTYEVLVVLDGCNDGTADAVRAASAAHPRLILHTLALEPARGVGRARRTGMDIACERLLAIGRRDGLIASTDADTRVAADWLAVQLELAGGGAQAIGGYIALAPEEAALLAPGVLDERDARAAERLAAVNAAADGPRPEHHHFSGASLALTARAYRRAGAVAVEAALEDEALERALRAAGVEIVRTRAVRVETSARAQGRAPRGLAHDLGLASWRRKRSYSCGEFSLQRLLAAKDTTVALILPTREVASTIGAIATCAARLRDAGLLDEVLVVDSASRDGSAEIAAAAGIAVLQEDDIAPEYGPARGKGDAMWRGLRMVSSEIVAFADTDSMDFDERFVTGLLGPLLCETGVWLVKGSFERPFQSGATLLEGGGGRVTELLARPLLNLQAPALAAFDQPLAGEIAARRTLLDQLRFPVGYGVEIAMLIDAWRAVGLDGLAQVDLGTRQNRHQSLRELSAMAYEVLVAAQARLLGEAFAEAHACGSLLLPPLTRRGAVESRRVEIEERAPVGRSRSGDPPALAHRRSADARLESSAAAPGFAIAAGG
ncbi:MAG TPA: glucosyl-3-phosphoglycerate synthase [Solirubrobacteraceae bacterium]